MGLEVLVWMVAQKPILYFGILPGKDVELLFPVFCCYRIMTVWLQTGNTVRGKVTGWS